MNLYTPLTPGVGFKGQILKVADVSMFFIKLSTKTYLTGVCYDLNDTEGELMVRDKWALCFVIYMFLSNNPSSGDINLSNLSCYNLDANSLDPDKSATKQRVQI